VSSTTTDRREHFRDLQKRSAKARSVRKLEDHIRRLVEAAPPLTDEQRSRLAVLLQSDAAA
jgi:hypothetical protein